MTTRSTIAAVTERLYGEFEPHVPRDVVVATVQQCCDDLSGTPEPALPELVERLARQRLTDWVEPDG